PLPQAWALQIESAWQWAIFVGRSVLIAIAVWTLVSLLRRWLPQSLVKLIPWFGRSGLDQWKSDVLSQFAAGLQNSRPAADLLATLGRNSRSLSMRNACTFAGRRVENGTDVPAALWHAKLINRQEQSWLNAAAANGNLPSAVAQAAKDIDRRFLSRWRLRMAWVTPLVTVLVSLYTLVFAAYLIGVLSYLVGVCAQ
ncbi:MAG: type II secretion system F family protein, partial [Planctomycetota bacterium]